MSPCHSTGGCSAIVWLQRNLYFAMDGGSVSVRGTWLFVFGVIEAGDTGREATSAYAEYSTCFS